MRIISQTGEYNFPYNQSMVIQTGNIILVKCRDEEKTFAQYSSQEKADIVMDELNDAYYRFMRCLYYHDMTIVGETTFQFPEDDEIEVVRLAE